ncbi:MAG TPA: Gfo/Idh/MocA family oxidoreductase [Thermomicrobiales bacterium]
MVTTTNETSRPIRLGIIGTGLALERLHWPALRTLADRYTIVAFADTAREQAERFAAYSGASMADYVADYRALLRRDDVEAVLVLVPIPLNLPLTRDCLAAGKHVICEKPAGGDLAEGRDFLALAGRYPDRVLLVAENWFYRDDLRLARQLLDRGAIGRPHLVSWRMASQLVPREGQFSSTPWRVSPGYRGGAHLDGGIHHIAALRLLCGDVARVHGEVQDANVTTGGPSDLTLTLRFASGAIGGYTATYPDIAIPAETNELRLYGTDAVMTLAEQRVRIHRGNVVEEWYFDGGDGGYYNELCNFFDAVRHGEALIGTVAQTYSNMQVVLGGLDAAETGRVTTLAPPPGASAVTGVPLWRPRGARDLFDGLPVRLVREGEEA